MDETNQMEKAQPTKPSAAEFLKNLPSYHKQNFSRFVSCSSRSSSLSNSSTSKDGKRIISCDDSLSQVIVNEKTSILLQYIHQQWDRKSVARKRPARQGSDTSERSISTCTNGNSVRDSNNSQNGQPARKMPRTL